MIVLVFCLIGLLIFIGYLLVVVGRLYHLILKMQKLTGLKNDPWDVLYVADCYSGNTNTMSSIK